MERFIELVRQHPDQNRKDLFIKGFQVTKEYLLVLQFFGLFSLDTPVEVLDKKFTNMRDLGYERLIKEELEELQKTYSSDKPLRFELYEVDENDEFVKQKLGGVSAFTDWDGHICFVVDPEEYVRRALRSTITHEYHHHWRMSALSLTEEN